jgi:8-oxo-dGTP diphosphatase
VGGVVAGTDAADAALVPLSDVLTGKIELAFDHARIVRGAVERVRVDLELRGIATAFVGTTFTLAELRAVYEAVWGVHLDSANFRRSLLSESGWVIPTGRRARPGSTGGKPAELYRAGRMWKHGGPIRYPQPNETRRDRG